MRRRALAALVAWAGLAAACAGASPTASVDPRYEADVRALADHVRRHPRPFHAVSEAEFDAAVDGLAGRLGDLNEDAFLVEVMRLTAMLGERDGHSGVFPLDPEHRRALHLYPIRLYEFSDGFFVVGEVGPLGLVGRRLVAVDDVPVAEVAARVRPLVPRDNEWSLRARVPQFLLVAEVLHGLGLVPDAGARRFTFEARDGARVDVTLTPVAAQRYAAAFRDLFHPMIPTGLPHRARPRYLARRNLDWWTATLDRGRAVYVAYNVALRDTAVLAERVRRLAGRARVRRVIVDLRHNPGGEIRTYGPLLRVLSDRRVDRPGRLYVLVGRTTFSAAARLAAELDRRTRAVFVGEPTGGAPNFWADTAAAPLEWSGWNAHVATRYWQTSAARDPRLAVEPEIRVDLSSADFFAGRDPVLAAAVRASAP